MKRRQSLDRAYLYVQMFLYLLAQVKIRTVTMLIRASMAATGTRHSARSGRPSASSVRPSPTSILKRRRNSFPTVRASRLTQTETMPAGTISRLHQRITLGEHKQHHSNRETNMETIGIGIHMIQTLFMRYQENTTMVIIQ